MSDDRKDLRCALCERPTMNVDRHFCLDMEYHVVCKSCSPLLALPQQPPVYSMKIAVVIIQCPTTVPEELRVIAAMRDAEAVPNFSDAFLKVFASALSLVHAQQGAENLSAAVKATDMSLKNLTDTLRRILAAQ